MRIVIDAKQYYRGPVSTRSILQALLPELFLLFPEEEWILIFDAKDRNQKRPDFPEAIRIEYISTPTNLLSNAFFMGKRVRELKADVALYFMFAPIRKSSATVVFIHDVLFEDFPRYFTWKERLYFKPIKWLSANADRLICTTRYVANRLLHYGYAKREEKIDIVPLAPASFYKPLSSAQAQNDFEDLKNLGIPSRYILYVGRLNARKNLKVLLQALKEIQDSSIPLVIAGKEDWMDAGISELAVQPKLAHRILFTGEVSNEQLAAIYKHATLFCFPSFAEGFGLPPLEAMASGVPVIVSNTTSLPEVTGTAALTASPDHPEQWVRAIDQVLSNGDVYTNLKTASMKRAQDFSWRETAGGIMMSLRKAARGDN